MLVKYILGLLLTITLSTQAASVQQLQKTCQKKSVKSCYELGLLYDQKNKLSKAASFYQKSCSLKHAVGCYKLAELYLVGSGVKQDDATFEKYMKQSCKLGYAKSCTFIKKAQPETKHIKPRLQPIKKQTNSLIIQEKNIGMIQVTLKLIDKQKRIIEIDASMRNDYLLASGWLSFSFPDLNTNQVIAINTQKFAHTKSYPKGHSIYHFQQKKAIRSRYLLVESDATEWGKGIKKTTRFTLRVPDHIKVLTLYIRGTLKHKTQLRAMPLQGTIGQQGFHNTALKLSIGMSKKKRKGMQMQLSNTDIHTYNPIPSEIILSRQDKLILLDQLLSLSYYHRERKAFEKQLKETLFGEAKYLTWIKSYHCEAKRRTLKSKCLLRLGGKTSQNSRDVSWEFQAAFTAKKDNDGLRITEMHSLDLLE